jgi:hypothetical protein
METYKIVRYFNSAAYNDGRERPPQVRRWGLSLAEAKAHCRSSDAELTRMTRRGMVTFWFEGYTLSKRRAR